MAKDNIIDDPITDLMSAALSLDAIAEVADYSERGGEANMLTLLARQVRLIAWKMDDEGWQPVAGVDSAED